LGYHPNENINKSLERALRIIEIIAQNKHPMKLQDISKQSGIPESTVLRILQTLIVNRYAFQDEDTNAYYLTMKLSYIGNLISSSIDIREIAKPFLRKLSEQCRESASLVIEQDMQAVYIDFVDGPDSLLKTLKLIGRTAPLHCTAVGKCILTNYSAEKLDKYISIKGLIKTTKNSIDNKKNLILEINKIKKQGYAIDNEECEIGVRCIAAPIIDYMGTVIASISITGPSTRLTLDRINRLKNYVKETAKNISSRLSGDMTKNKVINLHYYNKS